MNNIIGNRTYQSIKNLYLNLLDIQNTDTAKYFRQNDRSSFVKEFATIKICGPRRSGHTTSIINFIKEFIMPFDNKTWLISAPTYNITERIQKNIIKDLTFKRNHKVKKTIEFENNTKLIFDSVYFLERNSSKESSLDGIIIDCASFIKDIDDIYRYGEPFMAQSQNPCFIFLE